MEDKTLTLGDEINRLSKNAQEVYYCIVRHQMNDHQIAARLRKLDRRLTHSQALKKAQNYVQIIRRELKIKDKKGRLGIIMYALLHGHI